MKKIAPWWNSYPFVRILIPFAGGIWMQPFIDHILIFYLIPVLIGIGVFVGRLPIYRQFRFRYLKGILIHLLLCLFGSICAWKHDLRNARDWFARIDANILLVEIYSEPRTTKSSIQTNGFVKWAWTKTGWQKASGKLRISFKKTETAPCKGSLVLISKQPKPILNLPGSKFNFREYLANQNIFHQVSLSHSDIIIIKTDGSAEGVVDKSKERILKMLDHYFPVKQERALAKALLVGYRDELDRELVTAYTDTGVIHVIAVSGLHLGLIYGLLAMIFKSFGSSKPAKILANLVLACLLWFFTLICGASPSVVRSAVMFSSLLLADTINAENNTGNALASSAFLLLCNDPFLLKDIGFQLSYGAVASLLIYNGNISKLYQASNRFLSYTWTAVSTSISAQILTTPLFLFHFGQFPLLFLLSNLVAVPVSGFLLVLLIILCITYPIDWLGLLIASVSSWCINFLNQQVNGLASISFGSWKNIEWNGTDLVMSYLLISFSGRVLSTKNSRALIFFLLTILIWLILALNLDDKV